MTIFDLSLLTWIVAFFCALSVGFAKAGLPSLNILVVTNLMTIFPAKASVGILLPMLLIGDIFAVIYYRRTVVWRYLFSLLPWVLIGILLGYVVLKQVNSAQLEPIIGIIVIMMVILHVSREKFGKKFHELLPQSNWFTLCMGTLGGFTTMVGNAAGGVMSIYFLVKGLPKKEFIGTGAWFYLFVNIIKFPFYVHLNLIHVQSLTFNLWLAPAIVGGAFIGAKVLPHISQKVFQNLILAFSVFGGIRLLF